MILDKWQQEILDTGGDICLRSGRQVGKSTVISIKASEYAVKNKKKLILVIASVERQAYLLFEKILAYLYDNHRNLIKRGRDKPTKSKIQLRNGSIIYCLPTGLAGYGIRGYTVDLLIADEAAFIPEDVWTSVTPMLAVTKGNIWLLSTPHGKEGYYYDCFKDDSFSKFHVRTEEILDIETRPEAQKESIRKKLATERQRMTKVQYAQEYEGEFIDELRQFFPTDLIKKAMILDKDNIKKQRGDRFLGVDIARMGEDESVFLSVNRIGTGRWRRITQIDIEVTTKTLLTETIARIKAADKVYNYKKIYLDDAGLGAGVFDVLLNDSQTKRKVIGINNARRSIEYEDKPRRVKLMKEDLYNNLLKLMEEGKVELFDEPEIMLSLRSVQYEPTEDKNIKIFGKYTHIVEALVRAAWCLKDKSLNIWIR